MRIDADQFLRARPMVFRVIDEVDQMRAIEWFQAPTGEWVTLRLIPARDAEGVVTAESLTDEGRVEIVRQRRSSIVAESVAVVSAMVKEFADVG